MKIGSAFVSLLLIAVLAFAQGGVLGPKGVVGPKGYISGGASAGGGTWSHLNGNTATCTGGPGVCHNVAFSSPLTNPSVIVVYYFDSEVPNTWTISDTAGNSYSDCGSGQVLWTGSGFSWQCAIAFNTHTTASNIVTMTLATGSDSVDSIVSDEWTDGNTNSVDKFASSGNNASTSIGANNAGCGTMVTTVNSDLIVCGLTLASGTLTAGSCGATCTLGANNGGDGSEYGKQTSFGSITPTGTDSNNTENYAALSVAVKP